MPAMETTDLALVPADSPVLRRRATVVKDIQAEVAPLVEPMLALMDRHSGIGLAAPQVGIGLRFFVTLLPGFRVVINPISLMTAGHTVSRLEGCLTFPGRRTFVARPNEIVVEWTDLAGKQQLSELSGMEARVVQHEMDHLNGLLIFP